MKKLVLLAGLLILALAFTACGTETEAATTDYLPETDTPNPTASPAAETNAADDPAPEQRPREFVTITDFNGNVVQVRQNPSVVAIYDNGILDMMYTIGFDRFGIETLIIPAPSALPSVLQGINNLPDVQIFDGGTLFYVNWDVLDLVPPELVILGARSFGMNAAGDRLSAEDNAAFREATEERYNEASFIRLTINAQDSDLLNDMQRNADTLAQIWPHVADDLNSEIESIREGMAYVHAVAQESGLRTVFLMMTTPTNLSLFLANSRMDMVYEEFGFIPAVPAEDLGAFTDQHGFESRAEFVLALDPDVIFLLDRNEMNENVPESAGFEALMADPIIQRTNAFENGHIYALYPQEWYTVVGGFGSARQMIACTMRFVENFRAQ
jgi:iron complex transport system substrate-binding protein